MNVVDLLLSKVAITNYKDNRGNSPIIRAFTRGQVNVVELLLSKGAVIPNIKSYYESIY